MINAYKAQNYIWMQYSDMITEKDDEEFIPILIEKIKVMKDVQLVFDIDSKAFVTDEDFFNSSSLGTNPDFKNIDCVVEVGLKGIHKMFGRKYEFSLKGSRVKYKRFEMLYNFEKETGLSFKNDFELFYSNDPKKTS